jgi:hypothetical protein
LPIVLLRRVIRRIPSLKLALLLILRLIPCHRLLTVLLRLLQLLLVLHVLLLQSSVVLAHPLHLRLESLF